MVVAPLCFLLFARCWGLQLQPQLRAVWRSPVSLVGPRLLWILFLSAASALAFTPLCAVPQTRATALPRTRVATSARRKGGRALGASLSASARPQAFERMEERPHVGLICDGQRTSCVRVRRSVRCQNTCTHMSDPQTSACGLGEEGGRDV